MAFIISKKSTWYRRERILYYLVENYRVGKKVKRKTLLSLSIYKSVNEFLEATEQEGTELTNKLTQIEKKLYVMEELKKQPNRVGFSYRIQSDLRLELEETKKDMEKYQKMKEHIKQVCSANKSV